MNYKYYKSSSNEEELFGIYDGKIIYVINAKGEKIKLDLKHTLKRMNEIQEYQYTFSNDLRKYLIKNIKRYIRCTDMQYRTKTLKKLLSDIEELEELENLNTKLEECD